MASIPTGGMGGQGASGGSDAPKTRPKKLTPKRPQSDRAGLADVFPYYAGFSFEWAKDQLQIEADVDSCVVLDPWNGSGTTTLAARANGIRSIGIDLNPIANLVAQLRTQIGESVDLCAPPPMSRARISSTEPLLAWFSSKTARRLRHWCDALSKLPRSQSALGYVSLFRVVRSLTKSFEGSNPTWVRRSNDPDDTVDIGSTRLDKLIVADQRSLIARLSNEPANITPVSIIEASATSLPLADDSVDFILTSPPYLTRIDYAVAYSRELAIFGIDIKRDRSLRSALMGTTLIRPARDETMEYGPLASELISRISSHSSKASTGYYLKQAQQYLDDLVCSFDELTRVSKKHAIMTLVVQDSYYKEIPIRLAEICAEEAERRGWRFMRWDPTEVTRHLTQLNTAARAYPKGRVDETVVTLRKAL